MIRGRLPRSTRRSVGLAAILALLVAGATGLALSSLPATSGEPPAPIPTLVQWLPRHSYPGEPQYDPRLDEPVRFWRAGLPLGEVFAGIREQTGVEIGFYPPGDENERVRVNLYLNPERPPTLRDLMSQLMWVTDCAFEYEGAPADSSSYRYRLLGTSMARGAEARLAGSREAASAERMDEWRSRLPARGEVAAVLAEYDQALFLSEDELVGSYYGRDDRLLATMLDPARRATLDFTLGLEDDSLEALLDGEPLVLDWQELSPEQQYQLRLSLTSQERRRGRGPGPGRMADPGGGQVPLSDQEPTRVRIGGLGFGQLIITAETDSSDGGPRGRRGRFISSPRLNLTGTGELTPDETIALRRGLGETVSDDEARALGRQWADSMREQMRDRRQERTREAAEQAAGGDPSLSRDMAERLSAIALPIVDGAPHSLWQVQEAVAAAAGANVVSDCFAQPARDLWPALRLLHPDEELEMTALQALRVSAMSTGEAAGLVWGIPGDATAGWEWESAGSFLRFRSRGRELWRASMLPPAVSDRLDAWFETHLDQADSRREVVARVDVPLDLREISLLAASLTDLQVRHGGQLVRGDPTDPSSARRQAFREEVLGAMARVAGTLRALASLGSSQWEQLAGPGLRVAYDLTHDQRVALGLSERPDSGEPRPGMGPGPWAGPMFGRGGFGGRGGPGGPGGGRRRAPDEQEMARMVVALTEERPEGLGMGRGLGPGGGRWQRGLAAESVYLTFMVDGEVRGGYPLPRVVSVRVSPSTPLNHPAPSYTP